MPNIDVKLNVQGGAKFREEMKQINEQAKQLDAQMKRLIQTQDKDTSSKEKQKQKVQLLNQQLTLQKDKLAELERAYVQSAQGGEKNATQTEKIKTQIEQTKTSIAQLNAELKNSTGFTAFASRMKELGTTLQSVGQNISQVGSAMTRYLSIPIATAFGASIKYGAEFEKAMSNVKSVTGATGEEFDALRSKAMDMGERTRYTAVEASDALYYMGLAGWEASESIDALSGVLNLASAGDLDLARTSDIVTDAMTAMHYSASEMTNGINNVDHFVNVLANTMSNSNTTVDLMGESFKYVAPVAGTLGYSIEDLSHALGLMANNGIKGSTAGTALRNILTNMANPTKEMIGAMSELGVELYDTEGNMLSFGELMDNFRTGFGSLAQNLYDQVPAFDELTRAMNDGTISEEEYANGLKEIIAENFGAEEAHKAQLASMLAGKRGMAGLLAIVGATDEEYQQLRASIYGADEAYVKHNGEVYTLAEAYSKFGDAIYTSGDEFEILGASAGMAEIQLDNLQGDFIKLTSALGTTKIKIEELLDQGLREFIQGITNLVNKFNSLDAEQKKMILRIATVIAVVGPVLLIIGKLISFIGMVASAIAMLASPIGIITAVVIGVVALIATIIAFLPQIQQFLTNIGTAIANLWSQLVAFLGGVLTDIMTWLSELPTKIMTALQVLWTTITTWLLNLWASISTWFNNALIFIQTFFANLPYLLGYMFGMLLGLIIQFGVDVWNFITIEIPKWIQTIVDYISKLPSKVWEWLLATYNKVVQWGKDMLAKATEVAKTFIENTVEFFQTLPDTIWEWVKGAYDKVVEWGSDMIEKASEVATDFIDMIVEIIQEFPDKMFEWGKNVVEGFVNGIKSMWDWAVGVVGSFFQGVIDGAKAMLGIGSPSKVFKQFGAWTAEGFELGFNRTFDKFNPQATISNAFSGIEGSVPNAYGNTYSIQQNLTFNNGNYQARDGYAIARDIDRLLGWEI